MVTLDGFAKDAFMLNGDIYDLAGRIKKREIVPTFFDKTQEPTINYNKKEKGCCGGICDADEDPHDMKMQKKEKVYRYGQFDYYGQLQGVGFKLWVNPPELRGQLNMGFFINDQLVDKTGYRIFNDGSCQLNGEPFGGQYEKEGKPVRIVNLGGDDRVILKNTNIEIKNSDKF